MRIPKLTPPDELPGSIEVRRFNGDLQRVWRPDPASFEVQAKTFWVLLGVLFFGAMWANSNAGVREPFGFAELAPVVRTIANAIPSCKRHVDCIVQIVLLGATVAAVVKLGFWLFWRFAVMRYAAKVEDETM